MALTAGLLTFLAVDAFSEALELQAALPGALQGIGLILIGVASSYLALTWIGRRFSARRAARARPDALRRCTRDPRRDRDRAAQPRRGLAIGSSFAFGELALGIFLIIGFMIHNVTEGLGIAAPIAEGAARRASHDWSRSR